MNTTYTADLLQLADGHNAYRSFVYRVPYICQTRLVPQLGHLTISNNQI